MKEGRIQHNVLNLGKLVENNYFGGGKLIKLDLKYTDFMCEIVIRDNSRNLRLYQKMKML